MSQLTKCCLLALAVFLLMQTFSWEMQADAAPRIRHSGKRRFFQAPTVNRCGTGRVKGHDGDCYWVFRARRRRNVVDDVTIPQPHQTEIKWPWQPVEKIKTFY